MNIQEVFNNFSTIKAVVLGDIMLDSYCWGKVDRISPEAPVPIVSVNKEEYRIGGAGNVALNLNALGASTIIFSVIGQDRESEILLNLLKEKNIDIENILRDPERPTTNKTRIMGRNQQIMRLDRETCEDIHATQEIQLLENLSNFIKQQKPQLLILEDYNKGVLTSSLIKKVIALAKQNNLIVCVDPKHKNFFAYEQVDIFKPNLNEVKEAIQFTAQNTLTIEALSLIHHTLWEKLHHRYSLITLSEKGMFFQNEHNAPSLLPAKIRNIADVSGAGDTVIAVISLVFALTGNMHLAAEMGNIAGGLVCEEVGTIAINKEKLLLECSNSPEIMKL